MILPEGTEDVKAPLQEDQPSTSSQLEQGWDSQAYESRSSYFTRFVSSSNQYGPRLDTLDSDEDDTAHGRHSDRVTLLSNRDLEHGGGGDEGQDEEEDLPPYTPRARSTFRPANSVASADWYPNSEYNDDYPSPSSSTSAWKRFWSKLDRTPPTKRARVRFVRGFIYAGILYAALWVIAGVVIRYARKQGRRYGDHYGDHRWMHGGGRGPPPEAVDDGNPSYCIAWDVDESTDLRGHESVVGSSEGLKVLTESIWVPINETEGFLHVDGPYSIGEVTFDTYDLEEEEDADEGLMKVDIEAIWQTRYQEIRVVEEGDPSDDDDDDQDDNDGQGDESWTALSQEKVININGWDELQSSSVCLMRRYGNESQSAEEIDDIAASLTKRKNDQPKEYARTGFGLGVYTRRSYNNSISVNSTQGPLLQFNLHVHLPSSASLSLLNTTSPSPDTSSPPSLLSDVLSFLHLKSSTSAKTPMPPPPPMDLNGPLQEFRLRGALMTYSVGNLSDFAFKGIKMKSVLGNVTFEELKAERISVQTTGNVEGKVSVGGFMAIDTVLGNIDVDVTLANSSINFDRNAPLPLYSLWTNAKSGATKLSVVDWEDLERKLHLKASSVVGTVTVNQHPAFEGDIHLDSTLGNLDVEVNDYHQPDPLGLGRIRNISVTEHERIGNKVISGHVSWDSQENSTVSTRGSDRVTITTTEKVLDALFGDAEAMANANHQEPGSPPDDENDRFKPGVWLSTSLGYCKLTL